MKTRIPATLRHAASVLCVFGLMAYVYDCFQKYDWGHPLIKLFCFGAVFFLIVYLRTVTAAEESSALLTKVEIFLWAAILTVTLVHYIKIYGSGLWQPPWVDIGYTTVKATSTLFHDGKNPYSVHYINARDDLLPQYRGFHYGPLMLIGYLPALASKTSGYKMATLAYLIISAVLVVLLLQPQKMKWDNRVASAAFALTLFFLPERFWYELFHQGANDIFPVMLLLVSLLALQRERYFLCGIFLGLSFSAKFSPGMFLLIPLLRRDLKMSIFEGFAFGLIPLFLFAIWDAKGLFNNVFWNRGVALNFDATSLYSATPPAWHFIFPVALMLAIGFAIYRNFAKSIEYESVLITTTLLLIVAEVTFKQMHTNHLIWYYPLFALILTRRRRQLFSLQTTARDFTLHSDRKAAAEM
jgi:hypothetical protein